MFRIFEISHYNTSLGSILTVFQKKKHDLILCILSILCLIVISSAIMYAFEHNAQPDKFSSIFSSMWWALATLSTIGYGDVYPITVAGKILTGFISILSILLVAIPTGIMSAGFTEHKENEETIKIRQEEKDQLKKDIKQIKEMLEELNNNKEMAFYTDLILRLKQDK